MGVHPENIHGFEMHEFTHHILSYNQQNCCVQANKIRVASESSEGTIKLDDYAEKHANPSVIKIDVEGGEYEVLQGATRILKSQQPTLLIEIHPHLIGQFDSSVNELLTLLQRYSYSFRWINHTKKESGWNNSLSDLPSEQTFLLECHR